MAGAQQTLRVKQKIEEKRRDALLGGGQKRIDTQHRKVCHSFQLYDLDVYVIRHFLPS